MPTKLLVHFNSQLRVNAEATKGGDSYLYISKYLEEIFEGEFKRNNPDLYEECTSIGITLHHKAISRAIGRSADGATFQLLDFICHVCKKNKTLIDELLQFDYDESAIKKDKNLVKYEVILPAYAIQQLADHEKAKIIPPDNSDTAIFIKQDTKLLDKDSVPDNKFQTILENQAAAQPINMPNPIVLVEDIYEKPDEKKNKKNNNRSNLFYLFINIIKRNKKSIVAVAALLISLFISNK